MRIRICMSSFVEAQGSFLIMNVGLKNVNVAYIGCEGKVVIGKQK